MTRRKNQSRTLTKESMFRPTFKQVQFLKNVTSAKSIGQLMEVVAAILKECYLDALRNLSWDEAAVEIEETNPIISQILWEAVNIWDDLGGQDPRVFRRDWDDAWEELEEEYP